jgi:hypothetical protein
MGVSGMATTLNLIKWKVQNAVEYPISIESSGLRRFTETRSVTRKNSANLQKWAGIA